MPDAIAVQELTKRFKQTRALDQLSFTVPEGAVVGLLGHNGAGKTTAIRILSTLLRPDSGRAEVFGADVLRQPREVRAMIGLTGQFAAVDEIMTGRENLQMVGRLFRLGRTAARERAATLLSRFDLADAADRPVRTYSGGMRRRLDVAASLMARPRVLFLDEPTTGLDPRSRAEVWAIVRDLVADGTTVLLTTQYLEEADRLADSITLIDHGRVIAEGSPDRLKAEVGGERLELALADAGQLADAAAAIAPFVASPPAVDDTRATVSGQLRTGSNGMSEVLKAVSGAGLSVLDITVRRPSLDEVYLALTGQVPGDDTPAESARKSLEKHPEDRTES